MNIAAPTIPQDIDTALGSETECAEKLQRVWRDADTLPHYPASTETVAELLRENGYDANPALLDEWVRRGMVPDVVMRSGKFAWSAKNILTARIHCDTWKRWIPLHPKHLHKQTAVELAEAQASDKGVTAFTDLDVFDVQAFTCMIERCDDRELRHVLCVALRTKLAALGVLDK